MIQLQAVSEPVITAFKSNRSHSIHLLKNLSSLYILLQLQQWPGVFKNNRQPQLFEIVKWTDFFGFFFSISKSPLEVVLPGGWNHTVCDGDMIQGSRSRPLTLMLLLYHEVHMVHRSLDVIPRNEFIVLCTGLSFQLHQLIKIPAPFPQQKREEVQHQKRDLQGYFCGQE